MKVLLLMTVMTSIALKVGKLIPATDTVEQLKLLLPVSVAQTKENGFNSTNSKKFLQLAVQETGDDENYYSAMNNGVGPCRGSSTTDKGIRGTDYTRRSKRAKACKALCTADSNCVAVEVSNTGKKNCELWTTVPGFTDEAEAKQHLSCYLKKGGGGGGKGGGLDPVCKECLDAIALAKDVIQDVTTPADVMKNEFVHDIRFLCTAASNDHPEDLTTQDCEDLGSKFSGVRALAFNAVVKTHSADDICGNYAGPHNNARNPFAGHACSGLHKNKATLYKSILEMDPASQYYHWNSGGSDNDGPTAAPTECFPGDAVVTTSGGRRKMMKDVSYGEKILSVTADGKSPIFDTVLFLLHRFENQSRTVTYVALQTASGHLLEVSPNHLVYLNGCCAPSQLEAAYNAVVSDILTVFINGTAIQSPIVSVALTEKAGFLNVGMQNGNRIVVNDIAATYFTEEHLRSHLLGSYIEYLYYFMGHILDMFPPGQVEYFVLPVQEFIETIYWPSSGAYTTIHHQCPFWLKPIASAVFMSVRAAISISIIIIVALILIVQTPSFWIILVSLRYLLMVLPKPIMQECCYQKRRRTSVKQEKQKAY